MTFDDITRLRLGPLAPENAEELLHTLVGDHPDLEALKSQLIERTEGNPFFLEESVRTLVESGDLVGAPGAYRSGRTVAEIQVPATVQAVLAARMDRLSAEEKSLLQTASVIGTEVPFPLLQAIANLPAVQLHACMSQLTTAEFLYETCLFPTSEYTFKHALTHDVAYGSLLQERRRVLHTRIVAALETLEAERLTEHIERLAHHAVQGEVWDKAVTYARQAGAKAASRSLNRDAATYFEQALAALQHLPVCRETTEGAIDLRFDLSASLTPLWDYDRVGNLLRHASRAVEISRAQKEQGYEAYALRLLGKITAYDHAPHVEQAEAHYRQALAQASELGMRPLQAHCHRGLGTLHRQTGQAEQARTELSTAIEMYRDMEMTFWLPGTEAALTEVESR